MRPITALRAEELPIGGLSRLTGVNIETIRYYEKIKLLPVPPRTPSGRRSYRSNHVRRLRFIRRARELGFGIEDIRVLLALAEPGHSSCAKVRDIATAHLGAVRAKLTDLAKLEDLLADTVARCSGKPVPVCPVLDMLNASRI
jgi:MerR family mercuric resistance operon transcriptional regulator